MNPAEEPAESLPQESFLQDAFPQDELPEFGTLSFGTLSFGTLSAGVLFDALEKTQTLFIDRVMYFDKIVAWAQANKAEVIDQAWQWVSNTAQTGRPNAAGQDTMARDAMAQWDPAGAARMGMLAELACGLRIPESTAHSLVAESGILVNELPATHEALLNGEISYRHARRMVDHIFTIPALQRPAFEAVLLPAAKALTVAKFDRKARRTRERMHPTSILERHTKSLADRKVHFEVETDGMGSLYLYGAADTLQAIYNRVSDAAVSLQGPGEDRTLTQLRTDVTTDLLLDGITPGGLGAGIHASVNITVPVLTLLGTSDEPGDLEGYGPIDPDTARRLAGTAKSFTRILTHPETGATLSVGKDQYKVPKDLKRWLRIRDETCRFPGCSRAAKRCDLDHTLDWQFNGATCATNLAYLCPLHHRLKHQTAWSVKQGLDGTLHWTSPGGKPYATDPATRIRPKPGSKPATAPEPTPEWPVDPPPF